MYADPRLGLKSISAFIKEMRGQAGAAQVRRALLESEVYALNARRVAPKTRRPVIVRTLNHTWSADLMDTSAHQAENDGVRFVLVVVDCLSKKVWLQPMLNKQATTTAAAFQKVLDDAGVAPKFLWQDRGTELAGAMKTLCTARGVKQYSTGGEGKAVIAERMIRTVRGRLNRLADARQTWRFVDVLQQVADNINDTISRTHGMKPNDVSADNQEAVARRLYKDIDDPEAKLVARAETLSAVPKFEVGDLVRVSILGKMFDKVGENNNWSVELFRVIKVQPGSPTLFWLADTKPGSDTLEADEPVEGAFYAEELTEAKPPPTWRYEVLRRERGRVFVHWVGWPKKYDGWLATAQP